MKIQFIKGIIIGIILALVVTLSSLGFKAGNSNSAVLPFIVLPDESSGQGPGKEE